ncbi:MAG: glycosyltransferase [archaeon]|nr:glycosyltransferase [archaeon]MCP8306537.1 glycosyltransferase [archaeon]
MESDISNLGVPEESEEALKAEEAIKEAHEETKVVVIFPARNEERTIGQCIEMVKKSKYHPTVIVADGYSTDNTRDVAEEVGAKVVVSPRRIHPGKGLAMKTGLKVALEENPDIVLFIDSDLENLTSEWVDMLIDGILLDGFDMTRGSYYRAITDAPVTKLVAKRLLWVFFPEISHFDQPLTGEVAAKTEVWKELLKKELPDGWGIDVTMLIETEMMGYRVKEVYLGYKQHRSYRRYSEDPGKLGKMAEQVAIAILKLAKKHGRIDNIDEIQA